MAIAQLYFGRHPLYRIVYYCSWCYAWSRISPNHKINNLVGSLAVFLYGLFDYKELLKSIGRIITTLLVNLIPIFMTGSIKFLCLVFPFHEELLSWTRIIGLMITFNVISYTIHIPEKNLTLFWVLPSILSSTTVLFWQLLPPGARRGLY